MGGPGNTNRQDTMDMVAAYQNNHKQAMLDEGFKATDWCWLPLDEMIDFLSALKYKFGCNGLRTYFAVHDKEVTPGDSYVGCLTTVFVGTQKKGDVHEDLDVLALDGSGNFDFVLGKKEAPDPNPAVLSNEDEDKQHLHPPDDDDNVKHESGDRVMHPVSTQPMSTNGVGK